MENSERSAAEDYREWIFSTPESEDEAPIDDSASALSEDAISY